MKVSGHARITDTNDRSDAKNPTNITIGSIGRIKRLERRKTSEKLPMLYKRYGKTKT